MGDGAILRFTSGGHNGTTCAVGGKGIPSPWVLILTTVRGDWAFTRDNGSKMDGLSNRSSLDSLLKPTNSHEKLALYE